MLDGSDGGPDRRTLLKGLGASAIGGLGYAALDRYTNISMPHQRYGERYVTPHNDVVQDYVEDIEAITDDAVVFTDEPSFEYERDFARTGRPDDWSLPETYLTEKVGDCEDHSFAFCSILRAAGYDADVIAGESSVVSKLKDGDPYLFHTMTVFETENGEHKYMDVAEPLRVYDTPIDGFRPRTKLTDGEIEF
ncbi:MAG: transglutaminase domain-containing protein [Candidatus Nanohaloarchaeota archaeon QJJ-5]|nr:transglutaminase domain-containing protein [Candidatus Nanohaloarchaeota archaeon QJJ-5]